LKLKRKAIEQKYKDDIQQLYQGKSAKDNNSKSKDSKQKPTEGEEDIVSDSNDNKKDQ
jgi:hypothetical protein